MSKESYRSQQTITNPSITKNPQLREEEASSLRLAEAVKCYVRRSTGNKTKSSGSPRICRVEDWNWNTLRKVSSTGTSIERSSSPSSLLYLFEYIYYMVQYYSRSS